MSLKQCSCGKKQESTNTPLIFSCSGCADVGEIADQAARKLTRQGVGKMFCLAGIGGRVEGIMKATQMASEILAIDGCSLDCASQSLHQAGFDTHKHLRLTDIGLEKGSSPASEDTVTTAANHAKALLCP